MFEGHLFFNLPFCTYLAKISNSRDRKYPYAWGKENLYTGQQKKGYKVIYSLFYKTEWHILFEYCKHNVCCFRVDLPNLNQVQWSETSARQFEWLCTTCTMSQFLGTTEVK